MLIEIKQNILDLAPFKVVLKKGKHEIENFEMIKFIVENVACVKYDQAEYQKILDAMNRGPKSQAVDKGIPNFAMMSDDELKDEAEKLNLIIRKKWDRDTTIEKLKDAAKAANK